MAKVLDAAMILQKEFYIHDQGWAGDALYVTGRLCRGDLKVGTRFNCVFHYRKMTLEEMEEERICLRKL